MASLSVRAVARRAARPTFGTSSTICQRRQTFHSYDHPSPASIFGATESEILSAAYKHIPEHGFTTRSLGLGARDAGYLDISPSVMSDGAFSLIRYHLVTQRLRLSEKSKELFEEKTPSAEAGTRVAALTWERLSANKDIIHQWQEALAIMAQPSYASESFKELARLSDEIWFLSGDTSVDSSWYTKRATLSMIYSTTELFMTNDTSADFVETNQFLLRRLEEIQSVGGVVGAVGQWVGFTASAGVNVLRSKGVRV